LSFLRNSLCLLDPQSYCIDETSSIVQEIGVLISKIVSKAISSGNGEMKANYVNLIKTLMTCLDSENDLVIQLFIDNGIISKLKQSFDNENTSILKDPLNMNLDKLPFIIAILSVFSESIIRNESYMKEFVDAEFIQLLTFSMNNFFLHNSIPLIDAVVSVGTNLLFCYEKPDIILQFIPNLINLLLNLLHSDNETVCYVVIPHLTGILIYEATCHFDDDEVLLIDQFISKGFSKRLIQLLEAINLADLNNNCKKLHEILYCFHAFSFYVQERVLRSLYDNGILPLISKLLSCKQIFSKQEYEYEWMIISIFAVIRGFSRSRIVKDIFKNDIFLKIIPLLFTIKKSSFEYLFDFFHVVSYEKIPEWNRFTIIYDDKMYETRMLFALLKTFKSFLQFHPIQPYELKEAKKQKLQAVRSSIKLLIRLKII
jgi:hypothetical protein